MFSSLGHIFVNKPRQAETTDTRLGIRRHEPEYERRKGKKKKAADDPFDQNDSATVSIDALRAFLENFLKGLESPAKESGAQAGTAVTDSIETTDNSAAPPGDASPGAPEDARYTHAARVYQTTARAQNRSSSILNSTDETAQYMGLSSSDLRAIHSLLNDLRALKEKNVEYLHIQRSENFLQSLVNAAAAAKNA